MILIQAKYCQKTVETSQLPLNVLPVFIITEQTVLVQSVYVKQYSLLSLHLACTLALAHGAIYSARQFQSAVHYIMESILELSFEI